MGESIKKRSITTKILFGLLLGLVAGIIFNIIDVAPINEYFVGGVLDVIGTVFINAIRMIVVPLVFASIVIGANSMSDVRKLGRIGGKTIVFYLVTTAIAITLAIILASIVKPGLGIDMGSVVAADVTVNEATSIKDLLIGLVPTNPVAAMVNGDMLQIIVFALLFGVSMALIGEKGKPVVAFFESFNEIMLKMIGIVMSFAPYGVFSLITITFTDLGVAGLLPLIKYIGVIFVALAIHCGVTYMGMLKIMGKLNPKPFIQKILPVMGVAFSTASSSATLPYTMKTAEEKCGVDNSVASFTLPLGATINMDGTSIMQGAATIFIAQVFGVELGMTAILTVIVTATLASIGTAGVPGAGLIMLSMVLVNVGLPVEGIAIIMGVDRIIDMARTAVNIVGDSVCSIVIAKSEGMLDEDVYNRPLEEFKTEEA